MKLFILEKLPWIQTQLIYHSLAYLNIESLVLHSSIGKYICVGLHQNPNDEIDLKYCKDNKIGIFRREIGGGTVLLDNNQIFYHLIINRNRPEVPRIPQNFFKKFLQPVIQTYNDIGISAKYQPLCDIVVNGKKISGNGGGEIGECKVLGGNILFDFDYKTMAKSLQLSENTRKRYLEMMNENLTTVKQELGDNGPSKKKVYEILASNFNELLGSLNKERLDKKIYNKMMELKKNYNSKSWLYQKGEKPIGREIKIREGVFLFYKELNISNHIERILCETKDNKIEKLLFSNSCKLFSENHHILENELIGLEYNRTMVNNKIMNIYNIEN
jgi:lipoate-protein ligase A